MMICIVIKSFRGVVVFGGVRFNCLDLGDLMYIFIDYVDFVIYRFMIRICVMLIYEISFELNFYSS